MLSSLNYTVHAGSIQCTTVVIVIMSWHHKLNQLNFISGWHPSSTVQMYKLLPAPKMFKEVQYTNPHLHFQKVQVMCLKHYSRAL